MFNNTSNINKAIKYLLPQLTVQKKEKKKKKKDHSIFFETDEFVNISGNIWMDMLRILIMKILLSNEFMP